LDGTLAVTALITTTFVGAALIMQLLRARGRRVPEDISVIALGDPRITVLPVPSITVVRFSVIDLARTAVDLLVEMLEGRQPSRHEQLVPVELVIRGSTGSPAQVDYDGAIANRRNPIGPVSRMRESPVALR
jgi:DNA-binding LacI/PurR family transcriptional regulator